MKKIIASLALIIGASASQAAPIKYQVTGTTDDFFGQAASVNMSFYYDNTGHAVVTNASELTLGLYSTFASISNLQGNVSGYSFSAAAGATVVATLPSQDIYLNPFFNVAGRTDSPDFNGFSINGYTLDSLNLYTINVSSAPHDLSLPAEPLGPDSGMVPMFFVLNFLDSNNDFDQVGFSVLEIHQVSEVPVPAAAWLMGSSLLGLAGIARRRKA